MTEQELNKACEWIANMPIEYSEFIEKGHCQWIADDFRKAMKGISGNVEEIPSDSCNSDKNMQELTWQDIQRIVEIADEVITAENIKFGNEETYYSEILRRFKNKK